MTRRPDRGAREQETDHRMTDQEHDEDASKALARDEDEETLVDEDEVGDDEYLDDGSAEEAAAAEAAAISADRGALEEPRTGRRGLRGPARPSPVAPSVSEQAVHITDRASSAFVVGTVAVFVLILLYGILLGRAGIVSDALATPTPVPTAVPSLTAAPSASESLGPSASASAVPSASASGVASPSPASPAPTAS